MLTFIKLVLLLALMLVLLLIGIQNVATRIDIELSPVGRVTQVPLSLALFYAYLAGLITFAVVYVFQDLKLRTQISRLKRENRKVADELHQLRSITLEDLPLADETESSI